MRCDDIDDLGVVGELATGRALPDDLLVQVLRERDRLVARRLLRQVVYQQTRVLVIR